MGLISEVGVNVVLREESTVTTNKRGDAIVSHVDHTLIARVDIMTGSETEVQTGTLAIGDAIAFFDPEDWRYIKRGNYFQHDGKWYVIDNVIREKIGNTLIFIEARARLIADEDAAFTVSRSILSSAKII